MKVTAAVLLALLFVSYGGGKLYSIFTFGIQDGTIISGPSDNNTKSAYASLVDIADDSAFFDGYAYEANKRRENSVKVQAVIDRYNLNGREEAFIEKDNELFILLSDNKVEETNFVKSHPMKSVSGFWKCGIDYEYVCTAEGCNNLDSRLWLELDFNEKTYRRCDETECSESAMMVSSNTNYTTITLPVDGVTVRISNSDNVFSGAISQGDTVISAFGNCMPLLSPGKDTGRTDGRVIELTQQLH